MSKFLLIDDDRVFHLISSKIIERSGRPVQIKTTLSAIDAIDFLKGCQRAYELPDVILLDIRMPEMDGFEFLDVFYTLNFPKNKEIIVYLLSSSVDSRDIEKAATYTKLKGFLSKPLKETDLKEIFKELDKNDS
ncbi:MAG: response regulator [Chitinophagaceae bacterium]|jgi:CheY-like chemotaxis protein|nr:response regulator [Chitinophagaceae bacterium]